MPSRGRRELIHGAVDDPKRHLGPSRVSAACIERATATDSAVAAALAEHTSLHQHLVLLSDAAEMLWVVLANVSGGDWTQQTPDRPPRADGPMPTMRCRLPRRCRHMTQRSTHERRHTLTLNTAAQQERCALPLHVAPLSVVPDCVCRPP